MLTFLSPTARETTLCAQNTLLRLQLIAVLRILRALRGTKAIPFTKDERRDIAVAARTLGWREAGSSLFVCAAGTVRGWFRHLVQRRPRTPRQPARAPGRPRIPGWIERLVCTIARRCPTWGYRRIVGMLGMNGAGLSASTVANILRRNGIPTAPERAKRARPWKAFCASHWRQLAACDFFTTPVITLAGLRTVYVLVVIHLATRRIHIAAVTQHPDSAVMTSVARALTMDGGILHQWGVRYLLHDGDGAFRLTGFDGVIANGGVAILVTAPRAPNMNAHCERVIRSIQDEFTNRIWFIGDTALRRGLAEYLDWYHRHRPHQGLGNRAIEPGPKNGTTVGAIQMRSRMAGTLVHWERAAA
ncbi:MAG: transposase [Planctomycetes bacterium]|nr:transposase [Planctomycetota bacterium]